MVPGRSVVELRMKERALLRLPRFLARQRRLFRPLLIAALLIGAYMLATTALRAWIAATPIAAMRDVGAPPGISG